MGWFVCLLTLTIFGCTAAQEPDTSVSENTDTYIGHRALMVRHLRSRGIRSQGVIAALMTVPRHAFVPPEHRSHSYEIRPLPIGLDQTISSPFIVAYMTEVAAITPDEKVLEIGTGSGYQAAILAEMSDSVYSIEILPTLANQARERLSRLGYASVRVRTGNGYLGWPEEAPFDAIVVTAAPNEVPQALVDQLAVNGRMVIPVGSTHQEMVILMRTPEGVIEKRTLAVRFVPMTGEPTDHSN
jgi:protein-L-isoaspartate(D-aspartate) O-methyltransferase